MRDPQWPLRAACRGVDLEVFYSPDEEDILVALSYCECCEVREDCLAFAMEQREWFGVWGGTTERERRRVFRAERRQRREGPTAA